MSAPDLHQVDAPMGAAGPPFTVVSSTLEDAERLLDVLGPEADVRVAHIPDWPHCPEPAPVGRALMPYLHAGSVVVLGSGQDDRDLAGWLVTTLSAPVVWGAETVRRRDGGLEVERLAHGGQLRVVQRIDSGPAVVLAKPAGQPAGQADHSAGRQRREPAVDVVAVATPGDGDDRDNGRGADGDAHSAAVTVVSGPAPPETGTVPLAGARVVVSVGRGIGGPDNLGPFRELATRLGAALGASRVVVDSGWLPFTHQVGQTGASVAPVVYLAFGISGAVQHQTGMRGSQVVVAVNSDPAAPLCEVADLVVEGDAFTVASALLERLAAPVAG